MTRTEALTTARWHFLTAKLPWSQDVTDGLLGLIGETLGYALPGAPTEPIAPLPALDAKPRIALCLGHGRPVDEGNVGAGGISEEDYNLPLMRALSGVLTRRGISSVVVDFYPPLQYGEAMEWLARHLKALGVTAAIEFHFNAANGRATGHEMLHWENSARGVTLARSINDALTASFPEHPDRGLKPKNASDRGALFLSRTHCPAVIAEPFFGDAPADWDLFSGDEGMARLITAYADGIEDWLESQEVPA